MNKKFNEESKDMIKAQKAEIMSERRTAQLLKTLRSKYAPQFSTLKDVGACK